jgi:PAS domain S-box-containing protein
LTLTAARTLGRSLPADLRAAGPSAWGRYAAVLLGVGACYFALARGGLALASINPSASPVWPPTGLALAAVLLCGYRVWPAIFAGAFAANATTAVSAEIALPIALGNTLEALVSGALLRRWSGGLATFETPLGVVRFAAVTVAPGALISATVGVGSLALAGLAELGQAGSIWLTWWLGNATGALVLTPLIVLWALTPQASLKGRTLIAPAAVYAVAAVVGAVAFSPLSEPTIWRGPLSFLAVLPLVLAALRCGVRDTATVAFILAAFAVWGTAMDGGPFARSTLNDSFLLLLAFIISTSFPSLVLSADVATRKRVEQTLRAAHATLDGNVRERTEALNQAVAALQSEVEDRRQVEAQLREQQVHLLEAQRLADVGSWSWDVKQNRVTWSDQLHAIYGTTPQDFIGTVEDYLGRVHPEDRPRVQEALAEVLKSGSEFQIDERIMRPDGTTRHLRSTGKVVRDESGSAVRMLGVCQDVTERKNAELALRESEQRYRLLVESAHDHAIFMLDPCGRIVSWNSAAERLYGYSAQEVIGREFSMFLTDDDRGDGVARQILTRAAETGKFETEGWRVRKDGSRFWASSVIDAIHDQDGTLVGFVKIMRDFTERRRTQAAIEETREKLAQAQKMEAIGQLTGGIAHDFNNLLMIVSGHAQILRRGLTDPQKLRAVEAIAAAASRGESLTRQLLAFARRQPLSPVVVDLAERIEAVREMLARSLRGDIEFRCDLEPGLWPVEVDASELELALVNIALNARDAMPDGGRIVLTGRNVCLRRGESPGELIGDHVAVAVSDTGCGIPRDVLPKVFEPFFTTKSVDKGTGLGLSQVYGFAQQSRGAVSIDSELGRGTTVTIYLPRSLKTPSTSIPTKAPQPGTAVGTILVVEDNSEVAQVTAALLQQLGYGVIHANSAAEALTRLAGGGIDLVFSDIVMPGAMDGIALAREIRARHPDIPVLLTSGYSDVAHHADSEFAIMRKPFQLASLDQAVRTTLQGSRAPLARTTDQA